VCCVNRRRRKMLALILIILGLGAEVVMANGWFIIPNFVPYVLFGMGGGLVLINVITYISIKKQ